MAGTGFRSRGHSCRATAAAVEEVVVVVVGRTIKAFSLLSWEESAERWIHATKQEWCGVEKTCLVGGKAQGSASLTKHESANMMRLDFYAFYGATRWNGEDSRRVA